MVLRRPDNLTTLDLLGLAFLITWEHQDEILSRLQKMETQLMALADTLAQLQTEDTELAADVTALVNAITTETTQITDLQAQIAALTAAGSATPEQLAVLQTVADDLAATHNAAAAAVPPAPAP